VKRRRLNGAIQESFDHGTATCSQEIAALTKVPLTFLQWHRPFDILALLLRGFGPEDIPVSNNMSHSHMFLRACFVLSFSFKDSVSLVKLYCAGDG
jgi:hypothetical protein